MMDRFLSVRDGYINTRYIRRITEERRERKRGDHSWWVTERLAYDDEGRVEPLSGAISDLEQETVAVVPANHPLTLVEVWWWDDDSLGDASFGVTRAPIVAWRIAAWGGYPSPIAVGIGEADGAAPNARQFIELPDVFIEVGYEGGHFSDLDACKEYVKSEVQRSDEVKKQRQQKEVTDGTR